MNTSIILIFSKETNLLIDKMLIQSTLPLKSPLYINTFDFLCKCSKAEHSSGLFSLKLRDNKHDIGSLWLYDKCGHRLCLFNHLCDCHSLSDLIYE